MTTIVVGVDGSAASVAALRWAVAEARLRRAKVRVVHVVGSRGHGVAGLLSGSVSHQCAHHSRCPVAIVRARPDEG